MKKKTFIKKIVENARFHMFGLAVFLEKGQQVWPGSEGIWVITTVELGWT